MTTPAKPRQNEPAIPDVFGADQRAEAVAAALMLGQQQIVQLDVQQRLNGDEGDTAIPDAKPREEGGAPPTYDERRAQIRRGLRLLMEDNSDLHDAIVALAAKWRSERDGAKPSS